jgi:hypothetical protein
MNRVHASVKNAGIADINLPWGAGFVVRISERASGALDFCKNLRTYAPQVPVNTLRPQARHNISIDEVFPLLLPLV